METAPATMAMAPPTAATSSFLQAVVPMAIDKATGRMVQMGSMGRDTQSRVMSLTMDALGDAGPQALRLPTQWVTYPTGEKEGTKGPELTIVTGPAAAPAAAAPVNAPATQAPAPAPAPR
jgi:hypothetical protein